MSDNTLPNYQMSKIKNKKLEINFNGGDISSDGGVLLLREADRKLCLTKELSKLFPDKRDPELITHSVQTMLRQRLYGLALGYEDLNDHNELRKCLSMQTAIGTDEVMASSPTLCRLENNADRGFVVEAHKIMVDKFIESYKTAPKEIILDFDPTDDQIHGNQEGKAYHGYYQHDCFLPLYVFCNNELLVSYLRPSNQDQAKHVWAILSLLVKRIRQSWPNVAIIFRADGGLCRHKILDWCDKHNVKYIVGMAKNNILNKMLEPVMKEAEAAYQEVEEKQRFFTEFEYRAGSWNRSRKIVAKAEVTELGRNPRYIVTNLAGDAKYLYDDIYCQRGEMENRIKEQELELFADRTSAHKWWANQMRLLLSSLAYTLVQYIRKNYLRGTELAKAQVNTIRLKIFKIGAIIIRNTRRIRFLLSSAYPYKNIWQNIMKKIALE